MKVRRLELQHLVDSLSVDFVSRRTNFGGRPVGPSKTGLDELFAVLIQQLECLQVRAGRDLDQLGKSIANLRHGQGAQKCEIQKGVHRCMICAQSVLVVSIIDRNFDGDRSINQANNRRRDADIVRVPTIRRTSKPTSGGSVSSDYG